MRVVPSSLTITSGVVSKSNPKGEKKILLFVTRNDNNISKATRGAPQHILDASFDRFHVHRSLAHCSRHQLAPHTFPHELSRIATQALSAMNSGGGSSDLNI